MVFLLNLIMLPIDLVLSLALYLITLKVTYITIYYPTNTELSSIINKTNLTINLLPIQYYKYPKMYETIKVNIASEQFLLKAEIIEVSKVLSRDFFSGKFLQIGILDYIKKSWHMSENSS